MTMVRGWGGGSGAPSPRRPPLRFLITFPSPQDFFPINLPATAGLDDSDTLQTLSPFQVSPLSPQISLGSLFGSGSSLGQVLPKVEFLPMRTAPPSSPEWTPFQAPRVSRESQECTWPGTRTAREVTGPTAVPPSAPGLITVLSGEWGRAGLQVRVLSDAGNLLSLWRLGTPSPPRSPGSSLCGAGHPLSLTLAFSFSSYSFRISRTSLFLLGAKRPCGGGAAWRGPPLIRSGL